jgi:hypothetical protein
MKKGKMFVVKGEMLIIEEKMSSPCLKQIKVSLDGLSYKRLEFIHNGEIRTIQWLYKGDYLSDEMEKIMNKIYEESN